VSALVISEKTTTVWELATCWRRASRGKRWNFLTACCAMGKSRCDAGRDDVDVSQADRGERSEGVTNGWQAARALGMRPEQAELAYRTRARFRIAAAPWMRALQKADDRLKRGGKMRVR